MSSRNAGDQRSIVLKFDAAAITAAPVTIPVHGSSGVDLGSVGRAFGLNPATVMLNGHFVSRGTDLVSSLSWKSLLSFFTARGLPAGRSLLDPIVVQGKPIENPGFKRKVAINDEKLYKKIRLFEGCTKEQIIGTDNYLCIKRQPKFADGHPFKKGKIGECSSDCHSSSNMNPQKNQFLEGSSSIEQSFGTEQETEDTDFLCINKRLKLDDDRPDEKGISGLPNELSNPAMVSTMTSLNCGFVNGFKKRAREDDMAPAVFCKRIK